MQSQDAVQHPSGGRVVDLSLLIAEEMPCWWSTHMPYQQKTFNYFRDTDTPTGPLLSRTGPYQTRFLVIDEHTGTHFDAPSHFIPPPDSGLPHAGPSGEIFADMVELTQLMGPAVVIDVPDDLPGAAPGVSPYIRPEDVERHEGRHGQLSPGDIVLFRSGWDERYYRPGASGSAYLHDAFVAGTDDGWPAPGVECIRLLLDRGIRCVGIDSPSMGSTHDGGPVHQEALGRGAVFIEALANLQALPNTGAWFCFAPLKIARGTGAPGRAFALVPQEK
ncbi:cyclase family protein [Enemella evansiae]|uniref:Cyclase n=1 Tax=Enemella evansiae TaxID=2016499 RepID=A0A255GCU7_9ACTN|nr:cyclase family protein [Enemella evansiae]OYN99129.1 cyclase [Enemella evansiae]OYO05219.1 cyclase [Enemella evansiae]OYO10734.1 cyclase [Enemella evansiae]PFG67335.1 kynurenine formamidase [Propionibacteriaceae bacterium ES.041]